MEDVLAPPEVSKPLAFLSRVLRGGARLPLSTAVPNHVLVQGLGLVPPPLSNSWIIITISYR